jgi:FkbM family methyltransferase
LGINMFEDYYYREWKSLLHDDEFIVDVGANIGLTVQRLLSLSIRSKIIAFEPSPRNLCLLKRNIAFFKSRDITIVECAVSNHTGEAVFSENIGHGGLSKLGLLEYSSSSAPYLWTKAQNIRVQTVTLDDYFMQNNSRPFTPTFIKIDVEGAGGLVLEGATELLYAYRPTLSCSYHSRDEKSAIIAIVANVGYRGIKLSQNGVWQWCSPEECDGCFLHPSDIRAQTLGF